MRGDDGHGDGEAAEQLDASDSTAAALPPPSSPLLSTPQLVAQSGLCLAGYLFHLCILSKRSLRLLGCSLGLDTLAGLAVIGGVMYRRRQAGVSMLPSWLTGDVDPTDNSDAGSRCLNLKAAPAKEKKQLFNTAVAVLAAPFLLQYAGPVFEVVLLTLVALGVPLSQGGMLGALLMLQQGVLYFLVLKFLSKQHALFDGERWVRWSWRRRWLMPVLGGSTYAASVALFNLIEPINQAMLPHLVYCPEGPVAKLANPSDKSAATLLLASLTPCIGAPIFEELQSRAFMLQAMTAAMPLRLAILCSGLLFGVQHMQLGLVLPLSLAGFAWGVMYVHSGNLLVPILIHALWNARVFLGSYLAM